MSSGTRRTAGLALILASLACASPLVLHAQTPEPRPVLGGHRFIWNPFTETALPTTYARNLTGVGRITGVDFVPSFDLGNGITVPAINGNILFAELEFEYMHRLQPWLGVWARVGGLARVGTSSGSLLAQGVSATFGYELGWLLRMYQSERFVLSGTLALANDGVTDVDLLRWARGVINGTGESLVSSGPRLRSKGGVRGAWGINESWGLQFRSEAGYGEPAIRGDGSEWLSEHGLSLSYDLAPGGHVPIGFVLSAASRTAPREGGNPDTRTADVGLRTAFTGRDNFLVAIDTNWNGYRLSDGDDASLLRAGLSLQLYF